MSMSIYITHKRKTSIVLYTLVSSKHRRFQKNSHTDEPATEKALWSNYEVLWR